jgi:hypothetical protein
MGQPQSGVGACARSPGRHDIRSTSRRAGGLAFGTPSAASLQCRAAPAVATSAEFEHAKAALPAPQSKKSRRCKRDYLPLVDFIFEEGPQYHVSWEPSQRHQRMIFALVAPALLFLRCIVRVWH